MKTSKQVWQASSVKAPDYNTKLAYYGVWKAPGETVWHRVVNRWGNPITYQSRGAAERAALAVLSAAAHGLV